MKLIAVVVLAIIPILSTSVFSQTPSNPDNIPVISTAPVSYRINDPEGKKVNKSGLHGYYKKGYSLTIYGDTSAIGFRADCDKDDDWSGATPGGTTQNGNIFERRFGCTFNPHVLYGTVLPGNNSGQNHFDGLIRLKTEIGDLSITYFNNMKGVIVDSVIGVVFDKGPHNQPGESSVATYVKFKKSSDNNQFIYIIFPNSAKYIRQIVGTKSNGKSLLRSPTNIDFSNAYKRMREQEAEDTRTLAVQQLLKFLSSMTFIASFDNATSQEKIQGVLKSRNDDRNLNQ